MGRRDDLDASLLPYAGSRIKYARSFHYHSWRGPHHSIPGFFAHAGYMSRVHSPTLAIRTAPVLAAFVGR